MNTSECTCIHPPADHDDATGACLATNKRFGPCPCDATPPDVRERLRADWRSKIKGKKRPAGP